MKKQSLRRLALLTVVSVTIILSGCNIAGVGGSSSSSHPSASISPTTAQVRMGDTQQFAATFSAAQSSSMGASTGPAAAITWSVNGIVGGNTTVGKIDSTGLFTPPAVLPTPGTATISVVNSAYPTLTPMAAVTLENPVPKVTAISPATANVGNVTITVTGTSFVKGAQIILGSTALTTTWVNATHLTAAATTTQAQLGKLPITVKNPDPGSATSDGTFSLEVETLPSIQVTLSPSVATLRPSTSGQFTATLKGATNNAVTWSVNGVTGGNASAGTISTTGKYTAPALPPSAAPVTVRATSVQDPRAAGTAAVTLDNPAPALASIAPATVTVGNFSMTLTGSNFVNGATAVFGGQYLTTKFVSSTQLTATGTALQGQVGPIQVAVQNPNPGSVTSSAKTVQVITGVAVVDAITAARFLEQSSWGPTPSSIAHVQQIGLQASLNEQFGAPISGYPAPGATDYLQFVQSRFFVNAQQGQDQLRQRVAIALSEIFVVSANKVGDAHALVLWHNMLQNDALGNYSTLLKDVTLSPVMGHYLDMVNNDGCNGCSPNENYAREVLQLFSVGLSQLNPDGSLQLDGSGNPVPTYTQDTIGGFAHVFTGWTYPTQAGSSPKFYNPESYGGPMIVIESHHDTGSKLLLNGVTLAAGGGSQADLNAALQNIFNHPNVGPFISLRLIQRLVTSNPSPEYIGRVTAAFDNNGKGVRGDLKAVVSAILMDPEARRGDDVTKLQANDGHLKEPILFVLNIMRAANHTPSANDNFAGYTNDMGQNPFASPTVFNYFPPDYTLPGTQILGPEFKILDNYSTVSRINFVNSVVYGGNPKPDLSQYISLAGDVNKLVDQLSAVMLHGQMSDNMRSTLVTTLSGITDPTNRARAGFYLVSTSSQYGVQH